ncbi:AT-rich interactive domain-containing protein 4B isoform X3 [Hypomesus transpacificus]|uniref:AT-rich interactive domain-containing protein 4B isoform X3 n=1 Tax=Hypomesus transpacificus TaxID=137520 RepID=UPI001F0754D4|nr:AT-rich interactive domain-containing protein 4B isoform X3 [Hypomesus transpacificus]
MKTLEEPPYLTVGTDVSAKYRGAFCEAKIKTAKRLVKAKVTFKPDLSTAEVQDEHIRGPLKVGAAVEVKNQDGVYQEATITKLTDASIYTVVFDDGDEKTLRRSSLCLKGARHFAESETLDRLPLTNPEHFGTPVIGKKGNRGRRSNPVQEEESSSSSSEEEEGDQKQNEDLFGKVVCVEAVVTGDKKKTTWYPALVISPDCHDDVTMKKDNIFVRSFKDGKFYTVLRKDVREVDGRSPPRADAVLKPALDAALEFQRQASVPGAWRTEVKDESSSSEEDDEDEDEEEEEEASSEEEEEEVEPYPEEKENFLQQLYKFMEDRGTPINKKPVLGYRNLNLFKLYRLVHKLGGFDSIESGSVWKSVYQDLGIPVLNSAAGYNVKCAYRKYLYGFEEYSTSTSITFRMDLPLKQGPKGEAKVEGEEAGGPAGAMGPPATSSTEDKTNPEGEPSPAAASVSKEEKPEAGRNKTGLDPPKAELKDGGEEEEDDGGPQKREADKGLSVSRLGAEGMKQEEEEQQEEDPAGRVVCRYDEWVKADKIVRPANKNVPKVKHRKKIKNKAERERDRQERLSEREDLGSSPNNRAPRPLKPCSAQEGFSKMEEASESSTDEDDREDEEGDRDDEDRPGGRRGLRRGGPPDLPHGAERWDGGPPLEGCKPPPTITGKIQEPISSESPEMGKRRGQSEFQVVSPRKRRSEGAAERSTKGPSKAKTRSTRSADWLPAGAPRRAEDRGERGPCPGEERAPSSSCSSEDEGLQTPEAPAGDGDRSRPKPRGSPSKKYNGIKDKPRGGRPSGFWDIPEKRAKMAAGGTEDRPAGRSKGQKDVWSSIQAQWPKKTLKELFSDSDTEAANSPPPAVSASGLEEARGEREGGPGEEALEEQNDKLQEFPSSGSNSVLNTPPTTPESPSMEGPGRPPSPPPSSAPVPAPAPSPPPAPLPPAPLQEEAAGGRSETDSSTVEVESLGGESQDIPLADGTPSPSKAFDGSLSCNSSSTCSLELSGSSQQDSEQKAKVSATQKRHKELQASGAAKKHKPNRKSLGVPPKKNRKTAHHSSDSEDQSVGEGTVGEGAAKSPASKPSTTDMKGAISPKCPGRTPPSSHKYPKHGDDHSHHREHHGRTPRVYKWSFQMADLEKMSSLERISFLQEKLQDIRNHYLSLKSEVASIDRRRKRMKKKERESTVAASSSSSSSSSPSSSSLTAAVMLTLADPPVSSSSSQNSGVSVECR